jgi:hypothetical protein
MGVFSLAGGRVELSAGEPWWAMVDPREWPEGLKEELLQSRLWDPRYGDRQQELVVIGIGMDEGKVRGVLDTCLLTDGEMLQVRRASLVLYFVLVGGWVGGWVAWVAGWMGVCVCEYVCVCVCTCIYIYIHARAHTHTCTYTHIQEMPGTVWPLIHDPWPEWEDEDILLVPSVCVLAK